MVEWIFSFIFTAMEARGSFYFLDTFLEKKEQKGFLRYKFIVYFVTLYLMAISGVWIGLLKCVPIILAYTFMNLLYYNVSFRQSLVFSAIDYAVIVLVDYVILCFCMILLPGTGQIVIEKEHLPGLIAKTIWIIILLIIRKCSKPRVDYRLLTGKELLQFLCVPLFTIICLLLMYCSKSESENVQGIFLFLSTGLVVVNFIVLSLIQNILDKEEKIRLGMLT